MMGRRVLMLAVCALCVVPFVQGSSRAGNRTEPLQRTSTDSLVARCPAKAGGDGCAGEKYNFSTRSCECAPSGTCTSRF